MSIFQPKTLLLILLITCYSNAQSIESNEDNLCRKRALEITGKLESNNPLRIAVERGQTGNCIRQTWMDLMEKQGIKRIAILIEYSWKNQKVKFNIKNIIYQTSYFSENIEDKVKLNEINKSGLDKKIEAVALEKAEKSVFAKKPDRNEVGSDEFQIDLLVDESLPELFWIF